MYGRLDTLAQAGMGALLEAVQADDAQAALAELEGAGGPVVLALAIAVTADHAIPAAEGPPAAWTALAEALAQGFDPNVGLDGWTALHTAAMAGNARLCRMLIDGGADPDAFVDTPGRIPLSWALFYAHTDAARALLPSRPPSLREAAALGQDLTFRLGTPLSDAARAGLDFYRPLPAFPPWKRTGSRQEVLDEALTWASRNGQVEAMAQLVDAGAGLDHNVYRGTAALWATYAGQHEALRWLAEQGADLSLPHDFGGAEHGFGATCLHLAAQHGDRATCELLLELGADPHVRDARWDGTPAAWALACEQAELGLWLAELFGQPG